MSSLPACLVFAVATLVLAGSSVAAVTPPVVSPNWSGYVATAQTETTVSFTSITGAWKVPAVRCDPGAPTAAAIWVGIGGYRGMANEVKQVGIDADCTRSGKATYYSWFELAPYPIVRMKLRVRPGNAISASVNVRPSSVEFRIANRTRGWAFTRNITWDSMHSGSAEWIVEAPTRCTGSVCWRMPLARFGSVTITEASATSDSAAHNLADSPWDVVPIQLNPENTGPAGAAGAVPGPVSADGTEFSVSVAAVAPGG